MRLRAWHCQASGDPLAAMPMVRGIVVRHGTCCAHAASVAQDAELMLFIGSHGRGHTAGASQLDRFAAGISMPQLGRLCSWVPRPSPPSPRGYQAPAVACRRRSNGTCGCRVVPPSWCGCSALGFLAGTACPTVRGLCLRAAFCSSSPVSQVVRDILGLVVSVFAGPAWQFAGCSQALR